MLVAVFLIIALCGCTLSAVETRQLSHARLVRQAPDGSDAQTDVRKVNLTFDIPDIIATIKVAPQTIQLSTEECHQNSPIACPDYSSALDRNEQTLDSITQNVQDLVQTSRDLKIQLQKLDDIQKRLPGKVCPYGFDYLLEIDQCLRLIPEKLSWNDARSACNSVMPGVMLATIRSSTKQEAVKRYIKHQSPKTENSICRVDVGNDYLWFSGQTTDPNTCGTPFVWKPSPEITIPFAYNNFRSGEPNCAGGVERCTAFWEAWGYTWNDADCSLLLCYICEF